MTGWNLPPGVSENMIPGNRPEDALEDEFWDHLINKVEDAKLELPEEWYDDPKLIAMIGFVRELEYTRGYNDGTQETLFDISNRLMEDSDGNEA